MSPSRFPSPSLTRAARELRVAREAMTNAEPGAPTSLLQHRENVEVLREAVVEYIAALERDGLPVSPKLRQELMLLTVTLGTRSQYRRDNPNDHGG